MPARFMRRISFLVFAVLSISSIGSALGHDVFKEPLEERYGLKTVSCKTCHPNNKDRSIHNLFGQMFEEEFKGMEMSKKYEAAKAEGEEAQAAYEKVMIEAFKKAMPVVEKKQLTVEQIIRAGLLNGTRLADKSDEDE